MKGMRQWRSRGHSQFQSLFAREVSILFAISDWLGAELIGWKNSS